MRKIEQVTSGIKIQAMIVSAILSSATVHHPTQAAEAVNTT